ncbi:MAG: hypothetical protein DMG23_00270 [Acidobacteria bacterium]|nr:MAG: hypothetical protein DMG23_00270 [Acidobacteriota bacterium]
MVRAQIAIRKGIRGGDKVLVSLRDGDRTNADLASGAGGFRLGLILEHWPDQPAEPRRIRMPMQSDCMAELSGGMRGLPQPQAAPGGRGGIVSSQPYFSSTMNASVRH